MCPKFPVSLAILKRAEARNNQIHVGVVYYLQEHKIGK